MSILSLRSAQSRIQTWTSQHRIFSKQSTVLEAWSEEINSMCNRSNRRGCRWDVNDSLSGWVRHGNRNKPYPGINRYRPAELTQLALELIYGSVYHCLNTWDSRFDHSFQVLQVTSIGVSYYALCLILEFRMKQMCCATQKHVELMNKRCNLIQVAFDYLAKHWSSVALIFEQVP